MSLTIILMLAIKCVKLSLLHFRVLIGNVVLLNFGYNGPKELSMFQVRESSSGNLSIFKCRYYNDNPTQKLQTFYCVVDEFQLE